MSIEIRLAGPGDESLFDRIAPEVFDQAVEHSQLAHYLGTPGHYLMVAIAGGEIVGQVAGVVHRHPDGRPTELYIDELAIAPANQRQGIAQRLLDAMLKLGRELGCEEAWVGTETDNAAANALYRARGAKAEPFAMYVLSL